MFMHNCTPELPAIMNRPTCLKKLALSGRLHQAGNGGPLHLCNAAAWSDALTASQDWMSKGPSYISRSTRFLYNHGTPISAFVPTDLSRQRSLRNLPCEMSDPSIPPAGGICPWNRLPMDLKGYILWLEYVPDGRLYVEIDARGEQLIKIVSRKCLYSSSSFAASPLHENLYQELRCLPSRTRSGSCRRDTFLQWGLEKFVGKTWMSFNSAGTYWAVMQDFHYNSRPSWVPKMTKMSLQLKRYEDVLTLRRTSRGDHLPLPPGQLRLGISPEFFAGHCRDIKTRFWNAENFCIFFDSTGLVVRMRNVGSIVVKRLGGQNCEVFLKNLQTLEEWLNQVPPPPPDLLPYEVPPPDGACPWDALPMELKAQVFEATYFLPQRVKVLHKCDHGTVYEHRRCAEPYISKFLVSQQWFEIARKLFLSHPDLICRARDIGYLLPAPESVDRCSWMFGVSKMTIFLPDFTIQTSLKRLEEFSALKLLRLEVCADSFPRIRRGSVEKNLWQESDFHQLWNIWTVPSGCTITVRPIEKSTRKQIHRNRHRRPSYPRIFASNAEMYERLLNVHIKQGRVEAEAIPETWEEVENLFAINRKGTLDLFREMKREKLAGKGSNC